MTKKRDLKRLVRERQTKTAESYVTARRHVLAQAPTPEPAPDPATSSEPPPPPEPEVARPSIPVVEMISLTDQGAELGMKCRITMASPLVARVEPRAALERLRDLLLATKKDPGMQLLRGVVLHGEGAPEPPKDRSKWREEVRWFIGRVRAGLGGVSQSGSMLGIHVEGTAGPVMMVVHIGFRPFAYPKPSTVGPRLVLTTVDELTMGPDPGAIMFAP